MKKLPIGVQTFPEMINGNYVYVDKTQLIHRMIDTGKVYFLSRPRRFGKSLTVSTLEEIFKGSKELFKGLWIYDKIDWQPHPVIHIDFSEISKKYLPLTDSINLVLNEIAASFNLKLVQSHFAMKFRELIKELGKQKQVVILIDEYDKPIIDFLEKDKIQQALDNRDTLKDLYSVLKGNDANIRFLFMTGVSKFSKVSIFSDLNHLGELSLNPNYAALTGYTHKELKTYFADYLNNSSKILEIDDIFNEISDWYNGYSWDGKTFVFNPFSILNFFENNKFDDYWFRSGTPTFLMKLIKERSDYFQLHRLEGMSVESSVFDKFDPEKIELTALLFQTGYLTIKDYNKRTSKYNLQFPNNEVRKSFNNHLLSELSENGSDQNAMLLYDIIETLSSKNTERFFTHLKILFKNISYPLIGKSENYFHTVFFAVIRLLGFDIETEVLTADGRIDAVIKTEKYIYIIEFKSGTADEAIAQIKKKEYALKYAGDCREIILLGIGFNPELKNVENYKEDFFAKS